MLDERGWSTAARLAHRAGTLYLAARVEAQPGVVEHGTAGRDNQRALADDSLEVVLAVDDQVYVFIVTAGGAVLDARLGEVEPGPRRIRRILLQGLGWNSGFTAATAPTAGGWQAELAIPVSQLWAANAALRINLVRHDLTPSSALCVSLDIVCDLVNVAELTPTFGPSDLDHRVPMYESDPTAIDRLAPLVLQ